MKLKWYFYLLKNRLILAIASVGKSKEQFPELITSAESALLNAIQNARETNILREHQGEIYDIDISVENQESEKSVS